MRLHEPARSFFKQRVEVDTVDKINRVQDIALGLRHLLPVMITNEAVDIHLVKRDVVHKLKSEHDHPGHPEENDVEACDQYLARIEEF